MISYHIILCYVLLCYIMSCYNISLQTRIYIYVSLKMMNPVCNCSRTTQMMKTMTMRTIRGRSVEHAPLAKETSQPYLGVGGPLSKWVKINTKNQLYICIYIDRYGNLHLHMGLQVLYMDGTQLSGMHIQVKMHRSQISVSVQWIGGKTCKKTIFQREIRKSDGFR